MKPKQVSGDRFAGNLRPMQKALCAAFVAAALAAPAAAVAADAPRRPNIVIILGDDLGFADLGSYGSEIRTPAIDALAKQGVRFTNFYTHASSSPTRSMLLTGVDTHLNGLGQHGRVDGAQPAGRGRVRGLPQRPGGHDAATAEGGRLSHVHGRQVAHGQGARPDPGGARLRARLLAARRRRQLLGHDELHRRVAEVGVHRGRALSHEAARRLLRDQDLHRQADQLHRRQPRRRQAVLRVHGPPGAARSVPPSARLAQPSRRRVRQGLGRGAPGAAEAAGRARHHAARHRAGRTDVVPARSDRAGSGQPGHPRQEDGAVCRHGREHGPSTSAGSSTT